MATHLVSTFDINYLSRAVALYQSGVRFIPDCTVHFLCLDDESRDILAALGLSQLRTYTVPELNRPDLSELRASRNRGEFAFTCKSNFLAYLLDAGIFKDGDKVIFADADILFFSSLKPFIDGPMSTYSTLRTPHNFPANKAGREKEVGSYNAGMAFYTIDQDSKEAIRGWARQCMEWCFYRTEDGKFADQMYIDHWHELYRNVHDVEEKGINLGTWNLPNYHVSRDAQGNFLIDGEPLICYHFHGMKAYQGRNGRIRAYPITIYHLGIYKEYLRALAQAHALLRTVQPRFTAGLETSPSVVRVAKQHIQRIIFRGK